MKILVGWDDPEQAELLDLYLSVEGTEVRLVDSWDALWNGLREGGWDVLLVTLGKPEHALELERFDLIRAAHPRVPVVGACRPDEVYRMAGFLTRGMRSYVVRDGAGDHFFLLHALLEGVVSGAAGEHTAADFRREMDALQEAEGATLAALRLPAGYALRRGGDCPEAMCVGVPRGDGRAGLVLADACGRGGRAALPLLATAAALANERPQQVLDDLAGRTDADTPLLAAVLDPGGHTLSWAARGLGEEPAGEWPLRPGVDHRLGAGPVSLTIRRD